MQKLITPRGFVLKEKDRILKLNKNAFKGNTSYLKQYKKPETSLESQSIFVAWVINLQEGKGKIKDCDKFFNSIESAATYLNNNQVNR